MLAVPGTVGIASTVTRTRPTSEGEQRTDSCAALIHSVIEKKPGSDKTVVAPAHSRQLRKRTGFGHGNTTQIMVYFFASLDPLRLLTGDAVTGFVGYKYNRPTERPQ